MFSCAINTLPSVPGRCLRINNLCPLQLGPRNEGADTQRLRLATNVVSSKFNLDSSYRVTKFDDKGKVVNLTLENENFTISVTIKDSERHEMIVD